MPTTTRQAPTAARLAAIKAFEDRIDAALAAGDRVTAAAVDAERAAYRLAGTDR